MGIQSLPLESVKARLSRLMNRYYQDLESAVQDKERKVAWCSSIGPCELLTAMGFEVYFPENHGAMLGASRMAGDVIPAALREGYSPEVCSYLTSDIGAHLEGVTPLSRPYGLSSPPNPDVILFNNNQCREVGDWFSFYARRLEVPLLAIQSPRGLNKITRDHKESIVRQLEAVIPELATISGIEYDIDRLREAVALSKECTIRWGALLDCSGQKPAPLTFFDHCTLMAPAVVLRGKKEAVDFYDELLAEVRNLQKKGHAAVAGEQVRFYWDGMPVWGRLRFLADKFSELKAAVVVSTYCNSWLFDSLDGDDPMGSMAMASLECFNVRDEDYKQEYMLEHYEKAGASGVIFHDSKTCPYNSNSRFGMPQRLRKEHNISTLVLDGDLNDLSCFSDEQAKTQIEAFVEQLGEN